MRMPSGLQQYAKSAPKSKRVFDIRIQILAPNENGPADLIAEDRAHRQDRNVAEALADGYTLYSRKREYIVPIDVIATIESELETGEIGGRDTGGGSIGGSTAEEIKVLGNQARRKFDLKDMEEGETYKIEGKRRLPGERNVAIIVESERG